MKILESTNISKSFHEPVEMQVLKNVTFDVNKGEFVCLTGKSGSGKSTLLYILSSMDTDFKGSVKINSEELHGKSNKWLADFRNHHIGFVFQFHFLLQDFSCLQNVMLPALKLGKYAKDEVEHRAYDLLKLLGVEDQAKKRAALLSGGQQQRVAIARSLINDPTIVICDEPTGNLDSQNTEVVLDLFKKIASERGQTFLVVTHDNDFASKSDRIIHMEDGQITGN
jgi:lipoprotein-releasing system ATP-binding protein